MNFSELAREVSKLSAEDFKLFVDSFENFTDTRLLPLTRAHVVTELTWAFDGNDPEKLPQDILQPSIAHVFDEKEEAFGYIEEGDVDRTRKILEELGAFDLLG